MEELIHYKELDIYYPQFDTIELRCTNVLLPFLHKDVTFAISGPYTFNKRLFPSHDRIVGWHITDGKLYEGAGSKFPLGTFVYCDGKYSFYDPDEPKEEMTDILQAVAQKNGMAFQNLFWFFDGERTTLWFGKKKDKKYHFRALSDYQGRLCIIESRKKTQAERFKDLLQELGVMNAMHLDTGIGWQNSWWRDANGKSHILHFVPRPFNTNKIVFRLNY